ncbi:MULTISPECIES: 3-ketoacyl-ACP reductase [unclassified Sphaerochaeta]|jgi:NAD(P)-dependent dehydrogenase (short-subunit alcohol dehydrogenase family)|uniref:3-ketoacyl-ACP reductase n=1 Tax=unclassified Sphaerochaeta TaxID=2637943 RepID=UPI000EBD5E72|nr:MULTISPECIES: 3-ketoacyl-ACP reductase [unclassified Sphaerochaeta]HCU30614.1 3-ketoacyl-ACP reductase [Sphaerochaeta sp.]
MAKTILVTGGGRGIGRGICLTLASSGFSVLINYAGNEVAARETQRLCNQAAIDSDQSFPILKADISDTQERNQLIEQAFAATGSLDGLVNNAGVAPSQRADLLDMSEESFDRLMHINLRGPVLLTQQIANHWKQADALQGKTIIFITSVSAAMVSVNRSEYCISKAGLGMAASLFAARLAGDGTLVYEIRPGIIKTDMTSTVQQKYDTLLEQGIVPQMRWGLPEDIGRTVNSLLQGGLPFSTGTVITVDGGLAIPRL